MKKFLVEVSLFALLMIGILSFLSYFTDQGFRNGQYASFKVWHETYAGKINAEVLIQGNSHAYVQVNPFIIDSVLQLDSYNIGTNGTNFDEQQAFYSFYRSYNRKPKMIIQCVDFRFLDKTTCVANRKMILPFLPNKLICAGLDKMDIPWYSQYLPFLKWQKEPKAVLMGMRSYFGHPEEDTIHTYKGFREVNLTWKDEAVKVFDKEHYTTIPDFNGTVYKMFEKFLKQCKQDSIKVVMVFTPHYYRFTQRLVAHEQYLKFLHQTAQQNHAVFLDYTNDSLCFDKKYFYNYTHLNKTGAEIFSRKLAFAIRAKMKDQ